MEKNILVIGSEGFIGKSFINHYSKDDNNYKKEFYMVDIKNIKKRNYYKCNVLNFKKISNIIQKVNPEEIYNFSGSFTNNFNIDYSNNTLATKNIFDSILLNRFYNCKILINGSATEYGIIKVIDNPIKEDYPLNPVDFYGLTKVYQTYLAKNYFLMKNINVYLARPFNIIGYGISHNLFIGRLINEIKNNLEKKRKITLGNLNNERDYLDIEDLIRAYETIMKFGTPGEIYNIGSGKSIKIQELLNMFLKTFEIDKSEVKINKNFIKKFDITKIEANNSKLKNLNWEPKISLDLSINRIKNKILKIIKC